MAAGTRSYGPGPSAGRTVNQLKQSFFDPEKVIKGMDRAAARALSRFGAFVRQTAKTSIRYRKAASPVGSPPSAHKTGMRTKTNRKTGVTKRQPSSPLRDLIFFAYDREKKEVIIGPAVYPSAAVRGAAHVLEFGGSETIPPSTRRGRRRAGRTAQYAPRPFMHPAFDREYPKLIGFFRNSI